MKRDSVFADPSAPAWVPDQGTLDRSRLLRMVHDCGFSSMDELHWAAIQDPEWFWRAVVDDLDVEFDVPFDRVLDDSEGKALPRWFINGQVNAARLCALRHAAGPHADKLAVVYEGDSGQRRMLTYRELGAEVTRFASNLAALGVQRGDRVVLFMPVVPEAVVAYLGCAMLGAISVPAFSGYGPEALATRMRDSEAVALVTADGTTRRGKDVPLKETADLALADAPTVRHVVVVRHLASGVPMKEERDVYWDELNTAPDIVELAPTGANDPLTIVYTSGTTGAPKGIVHSHAGFGVKAAFDFAYCFDLHEDDVVAWIGDMGWLLGPLLITGPLQLGATIVLIEGVPTYPTTDRMWDIAERNGVTLQGVAPTAMRAVMAASPTTDRDLSSLRAFASTGEAWDEPTWHWLFDQIGQRRCPIINYSGGTEVGGGLVVSYPFVPMEAAAFNGPVVGVDSVVLDSDGAPVVDQVGELAVLNTFPGMTHAFWGDRARYVETYWSRWKDVWVHGDLASVDRHGSWRIHGRSDDTIKVSGRRVGPAEIEAALLKDKRIVEVAAIGVPDEQRGQSIVAFVVLAPDSDTDGLEDTAIKNVGRSFAPALQIVATLPKTKNGKIMRRAIRARHLGNELGDMSSLDPATPLSDIPRRAPVTT